MTSARSAEEPVVISTFDLPDGDRLLLHSCEDCACPVSSDANARYPVESISPDDPGLWVRGTEIIEIPLDPEYRLLFNPVGAGGVVVVNQSAYRVFRRFDQPVALGEVPSAEPFGRLEMIHRAEAPTRPRFGGDTMLTAWLHVTNACNLRCPYCYLNKSAEAMDEPVGRAAVEAVFRSAVTHGFPAVKLKYAGGEASLNHRLLVELHAHARTLARRHGLELHGTLLSNGVVLPATLIETLKDTGIKVMISLDGLGDAHDVQRPFMDGRPSFDRVERTIGRLLDHGHPPHLSITMTNLNAGGVADVVRFALERELTFSFNFFRDNDCATNFPELRYQEQAMISALLDAFGVIEEFLPPWSVLGSVLDRGQLLQPRRRSCGVGQDYVVIDQHGKVAKCHMEIERTLGDIFGDDPLDLVRRDRTTALNLLVEEKEGCRDCTWRHWCSGGCTVATFRATGRYDIKSPNCGIYKAIYPEALRLEGLRLLKYAPAG
jgi:uncharacterized protein